MGLLLVAITPWASTVWTPHNNGNTCMVEMTIQLPTDFAFSFTRTCANSAKVFRKSKYLQPVVEGMGLAWAVQHRKLSAKFSACITEMVMQLSGNTQMRQWAKLDGGDSRRDAAPLQATASALLGGTVGGTLATVGRHVPR
ncbi:hypothetical protein D3C72_417110 [compost metagenome]